MVERGKKRHMKKEKGEQGKHPERKRAGMKEKVTLAEQTNRVTITRIC